MNTVTDVVLCALVALYLFLALAFDLRLLILPSIVAMACVLVVAVAQHHDLEQL